jgi:hypothetical protein
LPERQIVSGQVIGYFGMQYVVPVVVNWPGTVIALNVGGALIPGVMSLYLLVKHRLWVRGLVAIGCIAAVCHILAHPVPGLGIALPVFVPAIATAVVALLLSRRQAAPLAYIGGTLGTLIGADLLNLGRIQGLGAPVASIGGAGTFDGVFLTGIVAVLFASFTIGPDRQDLTSQTTRGGANRLPEKENMLANDLRTSNRITETGKRIHNGSPWARPHRVVSSAAFLRFRCP